MFISQPGPFHSLPWPGRETKCFTSSLQAQSCTGDSNISPRMGCSLQNHSSASFPAEDNIPSHSVQPSLAAGLMWASPANSRPSVTLLLKRASPSASKVLGCFGLHSPCCCCWAFCKYLRIQPLSYRHGNIISQKRDGSKDKEKTWAGLAQSLLLSSFVYDMCKGGKQRRRKDSVHLWCIIALLKANLMICSFTLCSSRDLWKSTWDRQKNTVRGDSKSVSKDN